MKQKGLLKTMFLLCALIVGNVSAWAQTKATIYFGSADGSTAIKGATGDKSPYTDTGDDSEGNTWTITTVTLNDKSFTQNAAYSQVGASKKPVTSITFTTTLAEEVDITEFSAKFGGFSSTAGDITLKVGETSVGTGSLNATNDVVVESNQTGTGNVLTVTVTNIAKGVKCYYISYTYTAKAAGKATTVTIDNSNITNTDIYKGTAAGSLAAVVKADEDVVEGAAVTWESDNTDVATIDANTGAVTLVAAGTVTFTASYAGVTDQYKASSNTYEMTVTDSNPDKPGTVNNPYTADAAFAIISALPNSDATAESYYVKGIVAGYYGSNESVYADSYKRYYISQDGTTTNQILVYNGKGLNNEDFSAENTVEIGDEIVVYGPFQLYNKTPEIAADNYVYSKVIKKESGISYEQTEYNITVSEAKSFVAPTLTNPNELAVTYSSSDENVAVVDKNTGEILLEEAEGVVTITATFAGDETYKVGYASYTITIVDPDKKGAITNPYTVAEVYDGKATGSDIYVKGYIVGEFVSSTTNPRTSGFTTDANIAIADKFTTEPTAAESIPVGLSDALKEVWGNKKNSGAFIGVQVVLKGNAEKYFSVKGIKSVSEVSQLATISDAEWATMVAAHDTKFPAGVTAYVVSNVSTYATLDPVTKIKAGEAVILNGEAGDYVMGTPDETPADADNMLQVGDGTTETTNPYVLSKKNDVVGFYHWSGTVDNLNGKVYIEGTTNAREFIGFSATTGIETVNVERGTMNGAFNLAGQRVAQPTKGLYIVNGKKVVKK